MEYACKVSGCNESAKAAGLCVKHYKEDWERGKTAGRKPPSPLPSPLEGEGEKKKERGPGGEQAQVCVKCGAKRGAAGAKRFSGNECSRCFQTGKPRDKRSGAGKDTVGRKCIDCGEELTIRARGNRCTRCRVRVNRERHEERKAKRNATAGKETAKSDMVNHPPHCNTGTIEVADFIADQGMGFFDGNVIKYVSRFRHKGQPVEDLKKARWYLDKLIDLEEAKNYEISYRIVCTGGRHGGAYREQRYKKGQRRSDEDKAPVRDFRGGEEKRN